MNLSDIGKFESGYEGVTLIPSIGDEALADFVRGVLANEIFTSHHLGAQMSMLGHVFMPLGLNGFPYPRLEIPEMPDSIPEEMSVDDWEQLRRDFPHVRQEVEACNERLAQRFLSELGMVWEYYSKAAPRSVNGLPIFFSARFLNRSDTDRVSAAIARERERIDQIEV